MLLQFTPYRNTIAELLRLNRKEAPVTAPRVTVTDRETLYKQVWKTPMRHLAKVYGVSDSGLAKICKSYDIPKPVVGYWMKLAHGKAPPTPPLPPELGNPSIRITATPPKPASDIALPEVEEDTDLRNPHHLVRTAKNSLARAKANEYGLVSPKETRRLDICVSRDQVDRALHIMDTLIRALANMKWPVKLVKIESREDVLDRPYFAHEPRYQPPERWMTCAIVQREQLQISLSERKKRIRFDPAEHEKNGRQARWWLLSPPKYDFVPSGRLVLRIHNARYTGIQRRWQDTDKTKLERRLADFIIGLDVASKVLKEKRKDDQRREAERQAALERRREYERLAAHERRLREDLESMAAKWAKACQIGEFLMAVDEAFPEDIRSPDMTAWLDWAGAYARDLDPLGEPESVPKSVEPDGTRYEPQSLGTKSTR